MSFALQNASILLPILTKFKITTPLRIANFLGQLHHESNGFLRIEENLNYSVEGLLQQFGRHRISESDARKYGYIKGKRKANQEAIGNLIYGGSHGKDNLGNTKAGDGYKFRGRGYIQLTGRANYQRFKDFSNIDVINNPDLLLKPEIALLASGWFWVYGSTKGNLNDLADRNLVTTITNAINGGIKGLNERVNLVAEYKKQGITLDTLKKKNQPSGSEI